MFVSVLVSLSVAVGIMIVFVCLRPETVHRTKKVSGALSGYHTKAFTIAPPRIDEVILKRLVFAQRIASGEIVLTVLKTKTSRKQKPLLLFRKRNGRIKIPFSMEKRWKTEKLRNTEPKGRFWFLTIELF